MKPRGLNIVMAVLLIGLGTVLASKIIGNGAKPQPQIVSTPLETPLERASATIVGEPGRNATPKATASMINRNAVPIRPASGPSTATKD